GNMGKKKSRIAGRINRAEMTGAGRTSTEVRPALPVGQAACLSSERNPLRLSAAGRLEGFEVLELDGDGGARAHPDLAVLGDGLAVADHLGPQRVRVLLAGIQLRRLERPFR